LKLSDNKAFLIVVLSGRSEYKKDAADAGADIFLVKGASPRTDALELLQRLAWHKVIRQQSIFEQLQDEISQADYGRLHLMVQACGASDDEVAVERVRSLIKKCLQRPGLSENEKVLLSGLEELARKIRKGTPWNGPQETLALMGSKFLTEKRGKDAPIEEWLCKASDWDSGVVFQWLDEESSELRNDVETLDDHEQRGGRG